MHSAFTAASSHAERCCNDGIHTKKKKQSFHYLPIRDRILKLLNSDIHHFFHTSEFVTKPVGEEVINFNVKILLNF